MASVFSVSCVDGWENEYEGNKDFEEKENENDPVNSFFEAYNIHQFAETILRNILTPILKKKHSERTEEEKTLIKNIIKFSKKEKPKISIDRQDRSNEPNDGSNFEDYLRQTMERFSRESQELQGLPRLFNVPLKDATAKYQKDMGISLNNTEFLKLLNNE